MIKIFILLQLVDKLNTNSSFDDLKEDYEAVSISFNRFHFFCSFLFHFLSLMFFHPVSSDLLAWAHSIFRIWSIDSIGPKSNVSSNSYLKCKYFSDCKEVSRVSVLMSVTQR